MMFKSLLAVAFFAGVAASQVCPASIDPAVFTNVPQIYEQVSSTYDWVVSPTTSTTSAPPGAQGTCTSSVYFAQYQGGQNVVCVTAATTHAATATGCEYTGSFSDGGVTKKFVATIDCDKTVTSLQPPAAFQVTAVGSTFTYAASFKLNTVCSGGPGPSPSPGPEGGDDFQKEPCSGGCAFLIIFFVTMFVYAIVAIVINIVTGKRGKEVAPNADLWSEIPSLIKDGVLFSIRIVTCKGDATGYQQV